MDVTTKTLLILIPGLPLLAAVVTALCGARWLRGASHLPAALAILASFILSVLLARDVMTGSVEQQASAEYSIGYDDEQTLAVSQCG